MHPLPMQEAMCLCSKGKGVPDHSPITELQKSKALGMVMFGRSTTFLQTTIRFIAVKFGTDNHVPQRMYPTYFANPLTFELMPPAHQCFHLPFEISQHLLGG